ncbi:hypothetical protein ACFVYG_01565 [Streptomyces sp. NPDC058256]|uniref:hypothetical protein n=1 Tax=Streptomyces sp. NPDC058256 TaxID=3346408 RepID=UPI0036F11017
MAARTPGPATRIGIRDRLVVVPVEDAKSGKRNREHELWYHGLAYQPGAAGEQ